MAMTKGSLSYAIMEGITGSFFAHFFRNPFIHPLLFDIRTHDGHQVQLASYGGVQVWPEKTEGQQPNLVDMEQQFLKTGVHTTYGPKIQIHRELRDDAKFDVLGNASAALGASGGRTLEVKSADVFNDAFEGARHTDEGDLSIVNASHVNGAGANSWSNRATDTLSPSAVDTGRQVGRAMINYDGELDAVYYDLLLVPPELETTGWEIVRSVGKVGTAENQLNRMRGLFDLVVWDDLNVSTRWFLLNSMRMSENLLLYMRVFPEVISNGDLMAGVFETSGYMRLQHIVRDSRFVYGSDSAES